jgi:hypothetical protein
MPMTKPVLALALTAALVAACGGANPGGDRRLTSRDLIPSGAAETLRGDTYDDHAVAGSSTGRAKLVIEDRRGVSDYDPDLGRSDGGVPGPRPDRPVRAPTE